MGVLQLFLLVVQTRLELLEVYTTPSFELLGSHEIKGGFDFNHVSDLLSYDARPVRIVRDDGTLAETIEFGSQPPRRIMAKNNEYSAFVQDRWRVKPHRFHPEAGPRRI